MPKTRTKKNHSVGIEGTHDRIVTTATQLFAKKGYDGTSTKEICEVAGVNIAAIHYHFASKEKLYDYIIQRFVSTRLDSARRTLQNPHSQDELKVRLEIFLRETIESILKQPELFLIIQREMEMASLRSESVFRETMLKHFETLVVFLTQAKKNKLLAREIEPFFAAGTLFSQIAHQTRIDNWAKRYFGHSLTDMKYRNRWIQHALRTFLDGTTVKG